MLGKLLMIAVLSYVHAEGIEEHQDLPYNHYSLHLPSLSDRWIFRGRQEGQRSEDRYSMDVWHYCSSASGYGPQGMKQDFQHFQSPVGRRSSCCVQLAGWLER